MHFIGLSLVEVFAYRFVKLLTQRWRDFRLHDDADWTEFG